MPITNISPAGGIMGRASCPPPSIPDLMGDAGACGFGVCSFSEALLLKPSPRCANRLPKNPKSVLLCLFPYFVELPSFRNLALYACLPDYHTIAGELLQRAIARLKASYPHNEFVPFVDSSPLDEVAAAVAAGLGRLGHNRLLVTEKWGTLCFIGELVTDLELTLAPAEVQASPQCEGCGACINSCPTGALTPFGVDSSRCLSAISQQKGDLTALQQEQLRAGGLIWGCDICSLSCPKSQNAGQTPIMAFRENLNPVLSSANLDHLFPQSPLAWRGKKVIQRNLKLFDRGDSDF